MTGDTHRELPDGFDGLLRKAMSIEPSPEFLPRVRERLSAEFRPLRWPLGLWLGVTAAAAVCVVAVALSIPSDESSPPAAAPPIQRVGPSLVALAAPQDVDPVAPALPRSGGRRASVPPRREPAQEMAVVMVDQRQRAALNAVIRMVSDGQLTESAFARTIRPLMQPIRDGVTPIGVTPLEVSPIAVGGVLPSEK